MLKDAQLTTRDSLREALRHDHLIDERDIVERLLPDARLEPASRQRASSYARMLVEKLRKDQSGRGGVDALLQEFSLSTEEGIVLMCLAEALLRVPDALTADRLIADKLLAGNWSAHVGHSHSLFVNASAWALLFTGKMVSYNQPEEQHLHQVFRRAVGRLGQPVIRRAVRFAMGIMGDTFVMGRQIEPALRRARKFEDEGYCYSYDMLGEGARTQADADRYYDSYLRAIDAIGVAANGRGPEKSPGISIKLSALHPRYEFSHYDRVMKELVPRLRALALRARHFNIGLTVDAEEAARLDLSLDVMEAVFSHPSLGTWQGFGLAVQAYQKRAPRVIEWAIQLARREKRRMMVRLVKGAYWDTEIKLAQVEGLADYPVFTRKANTDVSYLACARHLLAARDCLYPQFATHNAYSVAAILEMDDVGGGYEFQRLHGMGEPLYDQVLADKRVPCRIYAPVGEHADLLAYLVRRLLENGANSSFVHNIVDDAVPVDSLIQDPVETASGYPQARHPAIPLPKDLYGQERANSQGIELNDIPALRVLQSGMQVPSVAETFSQGANEVRNPAQLNDLVGYLNYDSKDQLLEKLAAAESAFPLWAGTPVARRAALLRQFGDRLQAHRDELMRLCVREAGKTIPDSLAEVREAIDFCYYYAERAETLFTDAQDVEPLGVVLCISPWNFPLAIFIGQVCAALAAGNTVLAKPAEQTTLIAQRTAELLRQSGLPNGVLELLVSPGKPVGETLVPDSRIKAVMFTGSTGTAQWISQALAQRPDAPVPLVAETGGQNAMIVDSTALPEQVVDDVIRSGFQSAGQRCSALRVLCLQDEIADKVIAMIKGAMAEMQLGDPALMGTDIGPVIDSAARERLEQHRATMGQAIARNKAQLLASLPLKEEHARGLFVAPRLYEIESLDLLQGEVFGPMVHVVRYKASELDELIDQINACGFGLTLGVHSRIQGTADRIARRAQVGNVYVNRDMIGAVVGVQPFGGRGLSGTGPKAGGPHYLKRLVRCSASTDLDWAVFLTASSEQLAPIALPGPTGESNTLHLEPRGRLVALIDEQDSAEQACAAISTAMVAGNRLDVHAPAALVEHLQKALPESALKACSLKPEVKEEQLSAVLLDAKVQGVLTLPSHPLNSTIARTLAQRQGALACFICEEPGRFYLQRFVLEKTVTINTTAAGGNASLMTLTEGDPIRAAVEAV